MKKLLFFRVGTMRLGMDLPPVISIHDAPPGVAGQIKDPNRIALMAESKDTPLYNLTSITGEKKLPVSPQNEKLIVVQTQDQQVGLIVDRVDRVVTVGNDRIEPLSPIFSGPAQSCFPRVLKHGDRLVLLLAPEGIVKFAQEMHKTQDLAKGSAFKKRDEGAALEDMPAESVWPPAGTSHDLTERSN